MRNAESLENACDRDFRGRIFTDDLADRPLQGLAPLPLDHQAKNEGRGGGSSSKDQQSVVLEIDYHAWRNHSQDQSQDQGSRERYEGRLNVGRAAPNPASGLFCRNSCLLVHVAPKATIRQIGACAAAFQPSADRELTRITFCFAREPTKLRARASLVV